MKIRLRFLPLTLAQIALESISEDLKAKNFLGGGGGGGGEGVGACPQTPLNGALSRAIQSPPQTFSMLRFAPPCDIF